ncbi:GAF and ANTAR domain-containing protein [Mycolicibacterium bacteremicum]|uniref:GAF and ANTAR domain-containing protein n=1 Tax=Mycolicibacterium bacteremicum TaxID=564198 RepID=UPI0026F1FF60|nr:GAF and ANTAR domain-containing protein [Mycolicibacterium bacteremicum]
MTSSPTGDLAQRMADLARTVALQSVDDVLRDVTSAAVELIPEADTAGILLIGKDRKYQSLAATDDLPVKLDDLQMTFEEGPCVQAALDDVVVRTDDFRDEQRWPKYSPAALELGVKSGLSFKLYTANRTAGALNLFSFHPNVWSAKAETTGIVLAAHAAAAILASRQTEELESAVASRDRIGQAKGIIMERFKIDDVQAFALLRKLSQDSNTRLADVADQVIATSLEPS